MSKMCRRARMRSVYKPLLFKILSVLVIYSATGGRNAMSNVVGYIVQGRNGALALVLPKPELPDIPEKGVLMGAPNATLFESQEEAISAIERTSEYARVKEFESKWHSKENRVKPISSKPEMILCHKCGNQVDKADCQEFYGVYVCHTCVPAESKDAHFTA